MERWTDIEFTMPTDDDYFYMESIAKIYYDDDDHWPVEEYNPKTRTIRIESIPEPQDIVVEFATELLEEIFQTMPNNMKFKNKQDEEKVRNVISNISYIMHCHTDNGGYTECDYIIERKGNNSLTMKESWFSHEDYKDEEDDKRREDYEEWLAIPDYGAEIDLKSDMYKK